MRDDPDLDNNVIIIVWVKMVTHYRGHMAAAGNHMTDQRFMDDTFYLSNMAPQVGRGFNRDKWEHLERYVRKLVKVREN